MGAIPVTVDFVNRNCNGNILLNPRNIIFCINGVSGFCLVPRSAIMVEGKGLKTEQAEKSPLPYRRY